MWYLVPHKLVFHCDPGEVVCALEQTQRFFAITGDRREGDEC